MDGTEPPPPRKTCTARTKSGQLFEIDVYNPMGGTTTEATIQKLAQADPDALVIPETKIDSNQHRRNRYRRLLGRHFVLAYSSLPGGSTLSNKGRGKDGRGKAGVLLAIAKRHAAHHSLHKLDIPAHLQGWVSHVRLAPPGGRPLEIIDIYMPTAAEDSHVRELANTYIKTAAARCAQTGTTLVTAGDWNATARDHDRSTGTASTADMAHRELMTAAQLVPAGGIPLEPTQAREPTYRQHTESGIAVTSRIDDVLVCALTLPAGEEWAAAREEVPVAGGNRDHEPPKVRLPHEKP